MSGVAVPFFYRAVEYLASGIPDRGQSDAASVYVTVERADGRRIRGVRIHGMYQTGLSRRLRLAAEDALLAELESLRSEEVSQ